jgi:hypothetical protein
MPAMLTARRKSRARGAESRDAGAMKFERKVSRDPRWPVGGSSRILPLPRCVPGARRPRTSSGGIEGQPTSTVHLLEQRREFLERRLRQQLNSPDRMVARHPLLRIHQRQHRRLWPIVSPHPPPPLKPAGLLPLYRAMLIRRSSRGGIFQQPAKTVASEPCIGRQPPVVDAPRLLQVNCVATMWRG